MHLSAKHILPGAAVTAALLVFLTACNKHSYNKAGYEPNEEYSGGQDATVFDESVNAFGNAVPGLSLEENSDFVVGNSFNRNPWVTAPSSTVARDGLGPFFNAVSCSSCHGKDGRGAPPEFGEPAVSLLMKLSVNGTDAHGGPKPADNFGTQLNPFSIPGVSESEGNVNISYYEMPGSYPDGTPYSLRVPVYSLQNPALPGIMTSPRVAPYMGGTGLIDALPASLIESFADPSDADGDGISGRPNYVWDESTQSVRLGRFGWKAGAPSVKIQVAAAFRNDIGITSSIFPTENLYGTQLAQYGALPNGGLPEIGDDVFAAVAFYTAALAVPGRRNVRDAEVLKGKQLFNDIGCAKCHIGRMQTGTHPLLSQLSNQVIRPYSDFLLHDMGERLADNRPEYNADGREWRTPPLWGIGLLQTVNNHTLLLHDGRARGYEEAILWHGGEAEKIKNAFMDLSKDKRSAIITFLRSL